MRPRAILGLAFASALMLTGCVQRRFLVETSQPGAQVYVNGKSYGAAPVDVPFEYYGKYDFTIVKDGYETVREQRSITAPWYAYPPFDFFAENVYPFTVHDKREVAFNLESLPQPNVDQLLLEGEALRTRGRQLPEAGVPPLREKERKQTGAGAIVPPGQLPPPGAQLLPPLNAGDLPLPGTTPAPSSPSPYRDAPGTLLPPQDRPSPETPLPGSPLPAPTNGTGSATPGISG